MNIKVNEINKGLVCHLPLNDKYTNNADNFIETTSSFGWSTTNKIFTDEADGSLKATLTVTGAYMYLYKSFTLQNGSHYHVKAQIKSDNLIISLTSGGWASWSNVTAISNPNLTTNYQNYEFIYQQTLDSNLRFGLVSSQVSGSNLYFKNIEFNLIDGGKLDKTPYKNKGNCNSQQTLTEDRMGKSNGATNFDRGDYITITDGFEGTIKGSAYHSVCFWYKNDGGDTLGSIILDKKQEHLIFYNYVTL